VVAAALANDRRRPFRELGPRCAQVVSLVRGAAALLRP
jgi:hypothetical protein